MTTKKNRILKILEAIPLSAFVISIRFINADIIENWKPLFIITGSIALIVLIGFFIRKLIFNRILLAINLYLVSGALAGIFNKLSFGTYFKLQGSGMILWVIAVGLVSTFLSSRGFIGTDSKDKSAVRRYSLYLLTGCVIAFFISFNFRGNRLLSELIPFTCLFLLQRSFQKKLSIKQ